MTLVRVWIAPNADPIVTADQVCNEILARGLHSGEVAITILNWGRGTLIGNDLDAMVGTGLPDHLNHGTPWATNGIAAMGAWTDAFVARYKQRQVIDSVPAPSRFHMDSELRLPALCYLPDIDDCWATAPLEVFDAMLGDPRWATAPLPMNPQGTPALLTMAQLHAAAGAPTHDVSLPRDHPTNRPWSSWWDGLMREAVEGAFDLAFFSRVRSAWPGVLCSEFAQSMRIDGAIEPSGGHRQYIDFEWWNRGWMRSHWCGRTDLQAPAFYVFGETFVDPGLPFMDEQIRLHRANLDACLHSMGGAPASTITPWVTLPGIGLPFGESPPTDRALSDAEFLRLIALFHGRGIQEFMVWPSADAATWTNVTDAIDAVWMPSIEAIEALAGSIGPEGLARIVRADRQPCSVVADSQGIDLMVQAVAMVPDACHERGVLWAAVELVTPTDAVWDVLMLVSDGSWRTVGTIESTAGDRSAAWVGPFEANGLVDVDGSVTLRLASSTASAADIDLIQIVHAPTWTTAGPTSGGCSCAADINGNGSVDGNDLSIVLTTWGTSGQQSGFDADIDGNGIVNGMELGFILTGWGPCGP